MSSKDLTREGRGDVTAFLNELRKLPTRPDAGASRGRLVFALDATASRERTWDRACDVQAAMFLEAERLGGLDVQLAYYRGFGECRASRWVASPSELVRLMQAVRCVPGRTQIGRVLRHALNETAKERVHALVFVGDAMEEAVDDLGHLAGELGLRGVRAFMFHEGGDRAAEAAFRRSLPAAPAAASTRARRGNSGSCCARSPLTPLGGSGRWRTSRGARAGRSG
jgi:hypothetical protein